MAERDIVMVEWTDCNTQSRWSDRAYTKKTLRLGHCRTFGEVLDDAEDYITVAGSVDDTNDNVNSVCCIPKSAIQNVTVLKKAE